MSHTRHKSYIHLSHAVYLIKGEGENFLIPLQEGSAPLRPHHYAAPVPLIHHVLPPTPVRPEPKHLWNETEEIYNIPAVFPGNSQYITTVKSFSSSDFYWFTFLDLRFLVNYFHCCKIYWQKLGKVFVIATPNSLKRQLGCNKKNYRFNDRKCK